MSRMDIVLPPRGQLIHWTFVHKLLCQSFGGNAIEWHIRMQNGQRSQLLIMRFESGALMPAQHFVGGIDGAHDAYILSADLGEWLSKMDYLVRHEGDPDGRHDLPVTLAVLKQRYLLNWPTIDQDIKKASKNGLDYTKAGLRGWWENKAIAWAKQNGKWRDVTDEAQKAHMGLSSLNKTIHKQDR